MTADEKTKAENEYISHAIVKRQLEDFYKNSTNKEKIDCLVNVLVAFNYQNDLSKACRIIEIIERDYDIKFDDEVKQMVLSILIHKKTGDGSE